MLAFSLHPLHVSPGTEKSSYSPAADAFHLQSFWSVPKQDIVFSLFSQ